MVSGRRAVLLAAVVVLVAATIFELVIANRGTVGTESGEAPSGETIIFVLALIAMLLGALLTLAPCSTWMFALAPAAAAFVTARFYTPDPYYAPTLRRYSDGGLVAPFWVYLLVVLAVLAGVISTWWRRPGGALTFGALFLLFATALLMGAGH
jgi:hypothetical protein